MSAKRRSGTGGETVRGQGDGVCHTLSAAMGIILVISRIDHEMNAYIAATAARNSTDMQGKRRRKIMRQVHGMKMEERYDRVKRQLKHTDVSKYLSKSRRVRDVRNGLAHGVDSITPDGATGNYEHPVSYSTDRLKNTLQGGEMCAGELIRAFSTEAKYAQWKKTGLLKSKVV